ncbi:MAG: VTT domain-containing protein [Rubripirellula sp.]|nr:VTT domain-containing protein [Rubripirellula sp.]
MDRYYRIFGIALLTALVAAVAGSYFGGGIASVLLSTDGNSEKKVEALRLFFADMNGAAPFAYVAMVVVEVVVAPIPGTLLYLPGGMIFGGFYGGLLSLLANVLGAGISCQLMRSVVGRNATRSFFEKDSLVKYRELIERRGLWLIVLLRLNPLTSSDLVSYASGLTTMRVSTVMLGTAIGMAPLCYAQSYLAATLFESFPWLIWPMLVACAVYVLLIVVLLFRLRGQ